MNYQEMRRVIQILKQGGASVEEANDILEPIVRNNGVMTWDQARVHLETAFVESAEESLSQRINDYIMTWRDVAISDMDRELRISSDGQKNARRQVIYRLVQSKVIKPIKGRSRCFRVVESERQKVEWKKADPTNTLPLQLPFGLHKHIETFPGNIGVIAGEKGSGKTALANSFIKLNMNSPELREKGLLPINHITSEGSEEEIHRRLMYHEGLTLDDWTQEMQRRGTNFSEAIDRDKINVIDYLEVEEGAYHKIAHEMRLIDEAVGRGFALVLLQKDPVKMYGEGGSKSIQKARFYITLSCGYPNNLLEVMDAKNWIPEYIAEDGSRTAMPNPNHLKIWFKLARGTQFIKVRHKWRHQQIAEKGGNE